MPGDPHRESIMRAVRGAEQGPERPNCGGARACETSFGRQDRERPEVAFTSTGPRDNLLKLLDIVGIEEFPRIRAELSILVLNAPG